MGLFLVTSPTVEPLSLAELKSWLKIDTADDDALLAGVLAAARLGVEAASGRKLMTQTWRLALNDWPPSPIALPVAPVQAVPAVRVFNAAGVSHASDHHATAFKAARRRDAIGVADAIGRDLADAADTVLARNDFVAEGAAGTSDRGTRLA